MVKTNALILCGFVLYMYTGVCVVLQVYVPDEFVIVAVIRVHCVQYSK